MAQQNVTGRQWIASETWTSAAVLQTQELTPYLCGTLGIAIRRGEIPGFLDFLLKIRPDPNGTNENSLVQASALKFICCERDIKSFMTVEVYLIYR